MALRKRVPRAVRDECGAAGLAPSVSVPEPSPDEIVSTHLAQGELALAAAVLLPRLDDAAHRGNAASGLAAALIRTLMLDDIVPRPVTPIPDDLMSAALQRLTAQLRQQDAQIDRLHAMVEQML